MSHIYWVYMMASPWRVLYIGVTRDLQRRVAEHRLGSTPGFSARYKTRKLVWFEHGTCIDAALAREKQLKGWSRRRKLALVDSINPTWQDLAPASPGAQSNHVELAPG